MFEQIGKYIASQGLSNAFMIVFIIIINNEKAYKRITANKMKKVINIACVCYFIVFVLGIVQLVLGYNK